MVWYQFNYFLGSVLSFCAGLFVLFRGETRRGTQYTWFLLCLATSLWFAGRYLMSVAESEQFARNSVYVVYAGAIFSPVFFLHFALSLLREEKQQRLLQFFFYFVALLWIPVLLCGYLTQGVQRLGTLGFYEKPGKLYLAFFLYFIAAATVAIAKLIRACLTTPLPNKKNQLKYVVYASLLGYVGGATSFLPFVSTAIPPFGAPISYCYTFIITYAIARYRLMDVNIVIKRSLVYALLLLLLLIPCYLLVIWGQQVAFGTINYSFSSFTLSLFIVVGFLFPKIRFRTEEALERALFKRRVDFRDTLSRSSKDMVSIVDLKDLSNSLVRTVTKTLGVDKATLYLLDEAKGTFSLRASLGMDADQFKETVLYRPDPLIRQFLKDRAGIVKEELEMGREAASREKLAERMGDLDAEISFPITSKDKLIGILNLGYKKAREIYNDEEIELLSTLTNQAAVAIENARLYENLKQSQDTLRRADRLSSLGLLTAGLAHEIRNPLVAIRTFTQLLPERYDDAEFREGFQGLALKEVDRICGLITDLLSFARPSKPNVAPEDMGDVIEGIARILETQAKEKGVEIVRDFGANLPKVWIDREQMKQVFMNLILNAIQAVKDGGSIAVSTRVYSRNHAGETGQFVQVEIRDSGIGIPEENLEHIFDPFFTNKDGGSGLGLSISHQIVQEHGGYITVESKLEKGTAFFINLPTGKPVRLVGNGRAQGHEANLSH